MASVTGIIFTALDTDADDIESWNRWYDLEHLPPNIALPEIAAGRRYVAPPDLHEIREPARPWPGFEDGKGVNVTIYLTSDDPGDAIQSMTVRRDELVAAGRMDNAGRRTVRTGDAMDLSWVEGDPGLLLDDRDVPFVAHSGIRVVLRRGAPDDTRAIARSAVQVDGVVAVLSFRSRFFDGIQLDLHLLEGEAAEATTRSRDSAPYGDVDVVLDAPFRAIVPFDYSFATAIRASDLPQRLDTDEVM